MPGTYSRLHESLQLILAQRMGWDALREVQERAYSAIAAGKDALVIAPTAGGKSEAALIPVMDDILKNGRSPISCIYISPLKALINDQEERIRSFCTPVGLTVTKWHGDVPKGERTWLDGEPPQFMMITPESLEVLLLERELSTPLAHVRAIIIDELHAFVESERGVQLRVLLSRVDRLAGRTVQRIGLSATAGNPEAILAWLSEGRYESELVQVPSAPKEKHFQFIVREEEPDRVDALVHAVAGKKALVFVNSRSEAEKIRQATEGRIRNLCIHHASLSSDRRKIAEEAFSSEGEACIICTSTLELGIDIGDLDVVVQAGPPRSVSSFLQRMGRSGRRGRPAHVVWILSSPCELLCSVAIVECAMQGLVEPLAPCTRPYNVFVQQLFLQLLVHPRIGRRQLIARPLSYGPFSGIPENTAEKIVAYLLDEGYLIPDGGMVMPGSRAEAEFWNSNGRDLFSVIAGGAEYRAVTPDGEEVGHLDARFVSFQKMGGSFSLAGDNWAVVKCDSDRNTVVVVPSGASSGSRVFWSGGGQAGYSPLICRMAGEICARGGTALPLGEKTADLLRDAVAAIPGEAVQGGLHIVERTGPQGGGVRIFSLHGIAFNRVLALLLMEILDGAPQVRYNDFTLTVRRCPADGLPGEVDAAIHRIRGMTREEIAAILPMPDTAIWKFARAIPRDLIREMASDDHYRVGEFLEALHAAGGDSTDTDKDREDPPSPEDKKGKTAEIDL
jgi:ATP-dependent Lhr-like helicase